MAEDRAGQVGGPFLNTDRELWREAPGDYYAPSLHVTEGGGIGMNVGGFVIVMPIQEWHALAKQRAAPPPPKVTDATLDALALFCDDVRSELALADARWPDGDVYLRLAALTGEVGELAEGVIKKRPLCELRAEAVQVAVTAYRVARVLGRAASSGEAPNSPGES